MPGADTSGDSATRKNGKLVVCARARRMPLTRITQTEASGPKEEQLERGGSCRSQMGTTECRRPPPGSCFGVLARTQPCLRANVSAGGHALPHDPLQRHLNLNRACTRTHRWAEEERARVRREQAHPLYSTRPVSMRTRTRSVPVAGCWHGLACTRGLDTRRCGRR